MFDDLQCIKAEFGNNRFCETRTDAADRSAGKIRYDSVDGATRE